MNFLMDKARSWALPYLETIAKGNLAFNDWDAFKTAFRDRFKPVNIKQAAQNALNALMHSSWLHSLTGPCIREQYEYLESGR